MQRAALISVSDRSGLPEFAKVLDEAGFVLLATSGSARCLAEAHIAVRPIEDYTQQPEILGGRVKTLHPRIHAGLLAKRGEAAHMQQLERDGILPIDVAVINLYPFLAGLHSGSRNNLAQMIELIDIGGPTMIRAAAKNFQSVWPVIDPGDYTRVAEFIGRGEEHSSEALAFRQRLAVKVFTSIAHYDLEIARYLSVDADAAHAAEWTPEQEIGGLVLRKAQDLRYGENPHQQAAFYHVVGGESCGWTQLQGKELSYNNLLDFDAAAKIARALPSDAPAVAIIKHMNPCGAAVRSSLVEALERARAGDPRSHFGGIIVCNRPVDGVTAAAVIDDFTEIVVAPSFADEAIHVFEKRKNMRLLAVDLSHAQPIEMRSVQGGVLVQRCDPGTAAVATCRLAAGAPLTAEQRRDLQFAWDLCAHVKSNAITLVKDRMLLAVGAGQMSRIDSVELALSKARTHGHDLRGAVAASDAFFPFSDCVEALAAAGITAVVAPAGAKRDEEVAAAASRLEVTLLFAEERHFRH